MSHGLRNPDVKIETGFCQCGCGEQTRKATHTSAKRGVRKGEYSRYLPGHSPRKGRPKYRINPESTCWEWLGKTDGKWGYGHASVNGRTVLAHRAMYEHMVGPIPDGLELDHTCGNRRCVNPCHLEPVTPAENVRRSSRCKLSIEIAEQIRSDYSQGGISQHTLARRYGVAQALICRIVNNQVWVA